MPVLSASDDVKRELVKLSELPVAIAKDLLRVSLEFARRGANRRLIEVAASKLRQTPESISAVIEAVASYVMENARQNSSGKDVEDGLLAMKIPQELAAAFREAYDSCLEDLKGVMTSEAFDPSPRYVDLRWRLDVQLGTRSLRNQVRPYYLLTLETSSPTPITLEADPVSLRHVTSELERALSTLKSANSRRMLRNVAVV